MNTKPGTGNLSLLHVNLLCIYKSSDFGKRCVSVGGYILVNCTNSSRWCLERESAETEDRNSTETKTLSLDQVVFTVTV